MTKLTLGQIKKLPPEQRIRYLKKLEESKKKETEEAEKLIESSESEVSERKRREEEEEKKEIEKREIRAIATGQEENLEEIVHETQAGEEQPKGPVYGAPLEEIRNIYQIATGDVYRSISELRNKAATQGLTEEEEKRFNSYNSAFSQITPVQAAYIRDEQARINVAKAKEALEQIKKYETGNY